MQTDQAARYFIKPDYTHKAGNVTLDEHREHDYWDERKVQLSRYYQRAIYRFAASLVRQRGIKSVLDVGCGPAVKLMEIVYPACPDVVGIDQGSAVRFAKERSGKDVFYADDFEKPTYPIDRKFDLILCVDVIEHMGNPDVLLAYIKRYAHKDSIVLLSTPERDVLRGFDNTSSPNPGHIREWNAEELSSYLDHSGFQIESLRLLPSMSPHLSRTYLKEIIQKKGKMHDCMVVTAKLK